MPDESPTVAELSADWRLGFEWVEGELKGKVCNLQRQGRWRPAWYFDLERDGEILPLYFRGDRGHAESERVASVLDHEANIYRVLEANGLPVPHVHAMCPSPSGIVMDRCPGRFNLATLDDRDQARAILEHYIELLAGMHAIDPAEFEAYGMKRCEGERMLALGDFDQWVTQYRRAKRQPEPMLEFALQWVYRNIPTGRSEVTFVSADSGQFLFEDGRVTALLDMETGYLGDP
ncbi:MAG: phosphotransferase, partial [Myxococcales bacterium]|nr:phosphotransferase [Myxococcales bacterium]